MKVRCAILILMAVSISPLTAAEGDASPKEHGGGGGGNRVQFVLKHADDLKLTDEQKTKLSAPDATKETVDAVLAPEQADKLKELFKARAAERAASGGTPTPPPPAAPPVRPHIEDGMATGDLIKFVLAHEQDLMLRKEQKKQLDQLSDPAAKDKPSDADMRKKVFDILMGQQIGKMREILQDIADTANEKKK